MSANLEISAVATGLAKGQFSFQFQIRVMPKNVSTTVQLHPFQMLARLCSKSFKLGFSSMWTENFQMYQLNLVKGRENKDEITNTHRILEKEREFQKNIYFCYTDYTKAFDCVDHNKLWKILQEMGIPDRIAWETCMKVKKQQLKPDMEQWTGSILGKEYIRSDLAAAAAAAGH